jgi:hypothetical protein
MTTVDDTNTTTTITTSAVGVVATQQQQQQCKTSEALSTKRNSQSLSFGPAEFDLLRKWCGAAVSASSELDKEKDTTAQQPSNSSTTKSHVPKEDVSQHHVHCSFISTSSRRGNNNNNDDNDKNDDNNNMENDDDNDDNHKNQIGVDNVLAHDTSISSVVVVGTVWNIDWYCRCNRNCWDCWKSVNCQYNWHRWYCRHCWNR